MEKQKLEKIAKNLEEDFRLLGMSVKRIGKNCVQLHSPFPFRTDVTYYIPKKRYRIRALFVDEEHQNNGYAREMIEIIEKLGKALGTKEGRIITNQNPEFWESFGYFNDRKKLD